MGVTDTDQTGQIGRGALFILGGKAATFVLMALQAVFIPKVLGPEGMGFYSLWLSVFFILGASFELGGSAILTRYLPEYRVSEPSGIRPLVLNVIGIKLPVILIILFAGLLLLPKARSYFLLILLSAIFSSIISVIRKTFYAYNMMGKYAVLDFSRVLFRFVLVLALFSLWGNKGILWAIFGSPFLISILFGKSALRSIPKTYGNLPRPLREYLEFGVWIYLAGLFFLLTEWSVIVLSKMRINNLEMIGFLGFALQISLFLTNFVYSVGESVFPSMVELFVKRDQRFSQSIALSWRYTNIMLFPIIFGVFALIRPAVVLFINPDFLPSVELIIILMPAVAFFSWVHIHRMILYTFKEQKKMFLTRFIEFSVFFVSGLYLIDTKGIIGAPISLCMGSVAGYVYAYTASSNFEKIPGYLPAVIKPLMASCMMWFLLSLVPVPNIPRLLLNIILGGTIYLTAMWIIGGIGGQDIERLKEVLYRRR